VGLPITFSSTHLLKELAAQAGIHTIHVTSVHRSVTDQAKTFYKKHVVEGYVPNYKNSNVAKIVAHARHLRAKGSSQDQVMTYMVDAIEHVHGGPASISTHMGDHVFTEVFDVAHYCGPTSGAGRHNVMTHDQARSFLAGYRKKIPFLIERLGHSAELGFSLPEEFQDEKCFHFEVKQLYDKLEQTPTTMTA